MTTAIHARAVALARDYKSGFCESSIVAATIDTQCQVVVGEDLQQGRTFASLTTSNPFQESRSAQPAQSPTVLRYGSDRYRPRAGAGSANIVCSLSRNALHRGDLPSAQPAERTKDMRERRRVRCLRELRLVVPGARSEAVRRCIARQVAAAGQKISLLILGVLPMPE